MYISVPGRYGTVHQEIFFKNVGHGDHMAIMAHMVPKVMFSVVAYIPEQLCVRGMYISVTGHYDSVYQEIRGV